MRQFCKLALLFFAVNVGYACEEQSRKHLREGKRVFSSSRHGDYFIQFLMGITSEESCTHITTRGLLTSFALKFAIKTRKNNKNTGNLTLGYKIDDTCTNVPTAMSRGIEIANQRRENICLMNNEKTCGKYISRKDDKLIAVIGAYYSFITIPLASLLGAYSIPQVTHRASTPLLTKRINFSSTFRTIPSDELLVEAMLSVIKEFSWTYIFAVGSDDDYGKLGLRILKKRGSEENICITGFIHMSINLRETEKQKVAKDIALQIKKEKRAKVVVMFNYALEMGDYILEEADKLGLNRIWLTSEAWNPLVLISQRIPKMQLSSIITISLDLGKPLPRFLDYVKDTIKTEYKCDIWLHEYIKQHYNCTILSRHNDTFHGINNGSSEIQDCTVNVSHVIDSILTDNPSQVNNLIDAVDSVIYAFDKLASSCQNMMTCNDISPKDIKNMLQNISFNTRQGKLFSYSPEGNPSFASYSIEQIQLDNITNTYNYKIIATWAKDGLKIDMNNFVLPHWSADTIPTSKCNIDCQPGEKRVGVQGCCWECQSCPENTITNETNLDKCITCPAGHHTRERKVCVRTPIIHLGSGELIGIVTITLSAIGIMSIIACSILIIIIKDSQVIQRWSKLFIIVSMVILFVTFVYTFVHVVRPTTITCRMQYIIFYLIFAAYSVVFLVEEKSTARFISKIINKKKNQTSSQIILFLIIYTIEIIMIIGWQLNENAEVTKVFNNFRYLEQCQLSFSVLNIVCYAYPFFLIIITLIQTFTENHTFKEDRDLKYLSYTCIAFIIISIAYIVAVNLVDGVFKDMVTLCTTLGFGYTYAGCMICTKIFQVIMLKPDESNTHGTSNVGFRKDISTATISQVSVF